VRSLTRGTFTPLARLSDWNLQAAVALQDRNTLNDSQQKVDIVGMRNFYRLAGIFLRYTYR
jgi:hypothetical protein